MLRSGSLNQTSLVCPLINIASFIVSSECIIQATTALHRMNMVSKRRGCRVYDASADGYSRAECISLILLQVSVALSRDSVNSECNIK